MEGYLSKKGKWIGSRVKRYMKLEGTILSNHHSPDSAATWQVSIKDASVTCSPKRKKLVIELYNAKMELYCETKAEAESWLEAFTAARRSLKNKDDGKENISKDLANAQALQNDLAASGAQSMDEKQKPNDALSMSFKVVKPAVRKADSDDDESDDDAEYDPQDEPDGTEDEHQPRNGPRIYEETPNSMLFKQFAFTPKK